MKTSDFDYSLPPELIAQTPIEPRDHSRLMVVNRRDHSLQHRQFFEILDYLQAGDVLVFNDSRVIPARLSGLKAESGGKLEILLLQRLSPNVWQSLVRPARRVKVGTRMEITSDSVNNNLKVTAEITGSDEGGTRVITFSDERQLPRLGQIALPPYIHTPLADPERYQTVYAQTNGSVAAPTAGLHFTPELIDRIRNKGVRGCFVTLHVGLDTFQPVREENPLEHRIHQEYGVLNPETADELSRAKAEGRRVICVGTTSVRLVEAVAQASLKPFSGWVNLFIVPGYQFQMVNAMITNFHLPRTTLMMLVSTFAGRDFILQAYQQAITQRYRFYSFGDAML
ncbi:MAG: tRNA preQ1(34) S-adenosylmethionine ribosyltransferase-isomerase QueA, partial [Dehalococcoidales bacterium]|nr:tRNA preQ1(34) S-adenosylmethionine ribosyltransferase-isomerase QueA [Dehalococcoidales bacterium]